MTKLTLAIAAKGTFDPKLFLERLGCACGAFPETIELIIAHDGVMRDTLVPNETVKQITCVGGSIFQLWGAAITAARGSYVSIMDINMPPEPGWLNAVLESIDAGTVACYGPVNASYLPSDRRIIGYLVEYVQFHAPIDVYMREIPGTNLVLRRDLIGHHALTENGFSKTALLQNWSGLQPICIDGAVVDHRKPFATRDYIVRRYRHGRCYAASRFSKRQFPQRLVFAVLTILLPFIRVRRIWGHVSRVPGLRWVFLKFLPTIIIAETAWSFGELCGYLAGDGDCTTLLD